MSTDTMAANASDEEMRLIVEKCIAEAKLKTYLDKQREEATKVAAAAAQAEEDKKSQASRAFAQAYYTWLAAKAGLEDPDITDDEQPVRWRAESEAERRLFTTPSVYPDQVWQKLEAFGTVLGDELASGPRRESVLMLALGSIKQDIINLDLLEAI